MSARPDGLAEDSSGKFRQKCAENRASSLRGSLQR